MLTMKNCYQIEITESYRKIFQSQGVQNFLYAGSPKIFFVSQEITNYENGNSGYDMEISPVLQITG